ncbi:MAG: hypothetical protein ACE5K2_06790 [Candidatus Zixiibacteriota bacterium]
MIKVIGHLSKEMGEIEKRHSLPPNFLEGFSKDPTGFIRALGQSFTYEQMGRFLVIITDFAPLIGQMGNIMQLPSDQKIQVAEKLKKIADEINKIVEGTGKPNEPDVKD